MSDDLVIRCEHCNVVVPQTKKRTGGRPKTYCDKLTCRREQRKKWHRDHHAREKAGLVKSRPKDDEHLREPQPEPKPYHWWAERAAEVSGRCQRCEGPVVGVYVTPSLATANECGVAEHCVLCGRERLILSGRNGVPYTSEQLADPTLDRQWSKTTLWRRANGISRAANALRVWRPARVAGGQGKTRDNKGRWKARDEAR